MEVKGKQLTFSIERAVLNQVKFNSYLIYYLLNVALLSAMIFSS